jgi:hypothetical protein
MLPRGLIGILASVMLAACAQAPTPQALPPTTAADAPAPTRQPAVAAATGPATAGPQVLTMTDSGFGQAGGQVGYGFLVHNTDAQALIRVSTYTVTVFDASGASLGTDTGTIQVLFPGETQGIGGGLTIPRDATAATIDVRLAAGELTPGNGVNLFRTDKATFLPDPATPAVSGTVISTYRKTYNQVLVSALLYDAAGHIIGGGFTLLPFISAGGQADARVPVIVAGAPSRVELYAAISPQSVPPESQ